MSVSYEEVVSFVDEDGNPLSEEEVALLGDVEFTEEIIEESEDESDSDSTADEEYEEEEYEEEDSVPIKPDNSFFPLAEELESDNILEDNEGVSAKNNISILDSAINIGSYTLYDDVINPEDITLPEYMKITRANSHKGMKSIISQLGVLNPIHVMLSEEYSTFLRENGSRNPVTGAWETDALYTGVSKKYRLIHGMRRVFSALENGFLDIKAIVWDFENPELGSDSAFVLGLILDRSAPREPSEIYKAMGILKMQFPATPKDLEYLLNLQPGEAMQIEEVAIWGIQQPEVYGQPWDDLLTGKKTPDQAYKALLKLRKEADKYEAEETQNVQSLGEVAELAQDVNQMGVSSSAVRDSLEMDSSDSSDSSESPDSPESALAFGKVEANFSREGEGDLQTTGERKRLPKMLRDAVLRRDNFQCQTCGEGMGILSTVATTAFEIHHTVSVMNGGEGARDDIGKIAPGSPYYKLVTLCSTCHKQVHSIVIHDGHIGITQEEFEAMPEHWRSTWSKRGELAQVILEHEKISGKKFKREMPKALPYWEILKENQEAIAHGVSVEESGDLSALQEFAPEFPDESTPTIEELYPGGSATRPHPAPTPSTAPTPSVEPISSVPTDDVSGDYEEEFEEEFEEEEE